MTSKKENYIVVDGTFRLLMGIILAQEQYTNYNNHLIIIKTPRINYKELLKHTKKFKTITYINEKSTLQKRFFQTYFPKKTFLSKIKHANFTLFTLGGPTHQEICSFREKNNNNINIYSESIGVYKFFQKQLFKNFLHKIIKKTFKKFFSIQHEYDFFYVYDKKPYVKHEQYSKLKIMPDLFSTQTFLKLSKFYETKILNINELKKYDEIFFGQPLSNNENIISREEEKKILQKIIGNKNVLVLLHPVEILTKKNNKYEDLPNVKLFRSPIPNELLLKSIKPKKTYTYYSTLGITNSLINKNCLNYLYPIQIQFYENLKMQESTFKNIKVSKKYVLDYFN